MMPGVRRSCFACRHCRCRMQFSTPGHMKRSPGSPRRFTRRNRLQRQIRPITRWSLYLLGLEADHVFDAVAQPILRIVVGSCVLSALRVDCAVIWQPSAGTRERALRRVRCCRLVADPRVAVTRPAAAVARPAVPREGRGLDRPVGRGRGQAFPVDRSEEDQSQRTTGTRKEEDPVDERSIRLENWKRTLEMSIRCSTPINPEALQEKYEDVFADQLGEIRGIEADIELDDNARPRFFRSRPVPFPLREKVNQELDRQLEEGARGQPRTTAQSPSAVRCAAAPREVPLLPEVCGVLGIHSHHRGSATERKEAQVASATAKDPVLSVVLGWARTGAWPGHANDSRLKPYLQRREQLTVIDGCVQLGEKVVIPDRYRAQLLKELHEGHVGIHKMKSLARVFLWWPGLDADIEKVCRSCPSCVENANMPKPENVHPWKYPVQPWDRVHIDFATFEGKTYLLLVDAYSKWPEVRYMSSTTATKTIEVLTDIFATHGFPVTLVSDNGPPFTSGEFQSYLAARGIHHRLTPPYHPASNGQAESLVRTFKAFLKRYAGPRPTAVAQFLAKYRTTPCVTTARAPAELLFGRLPRTKLSLLKPSVAARMRHEPVDTVSRSFLAGQPVLVRDLRPAATEKWQRAVVVAIGGPLTYSVRLPDGRIRLAHVDHLLADGSASVTAERGPLDARVTVPPPTEPGKLRGPAVPCVMDARGRFPYISDYNKRATCEGNRGARASEPVEAVPALRRSARLAKKTC
ncbi:uncharacterized protein LOC122364110 isoform X2 [Amphibalanus amphitrite]|uniref:uncharacterized protein LOC122364110 isoform X2 n=1 Tax=Amphibalanus amphitrite TaxID=1232801 RepID=UPI001C90A5DA|nr:uncharacterized protein LOC122364110 isoform X2 [Amphibalanus amphitrite]